MSGVGDRLRSRRRELGLSQRDLAEPGVSYAYISRIETGARDPSVKALRKVAPKLDVSAHWLETGEEEPLERYVREIGRLGGLCERTLRLADTGRLRGDEGLDDLVIALRRALGRDRPANRLNS